MFYFLAKIWFSFFFFFFLVWVKVILFLFLFLFLKHQMLIKRLKKKIVPLAIDFFFITTQLAIDIFYSFFWAKIWIFFFLVEAKIWIWYILHTYTFILYCILLTFHFNYHSRLQRELYFLLASKFSIDVNGQISLKKNSFPFFSSS